jgi:hypothetical protein
MPVGNNADRRPTRDQTSKLYSKLSIADHAPGIRTDSELNYGTVICGTVQGASVLVAALIVPTCQQISLLASSSLWLFCSYYSTGIPSKQ